MSRARSSHADFSGPVDTLQLGGSIPPSWIAAPEGTGAAAPKEMRPAILDRILNDGQRREQVREQVADMLRQRERGLDRGGLSR